MSVQMDSATMPLKTAPRNAAYLHRYNSPNPRRLHIKMYLFPYAGGSAGIFRNWPTYFDDSYELVGIQLPGRGSRMGEPAQVDYRVLVRDITEAILSDHQGVRFALFGHSMGALLAHQVAIELAKRGSAQPESLFLSGRKAPHLPVQRQPVATMTDADFVAELHRLEGTPKALLDDVELMQLLLPTIKADFILLDLWMANTSPAPETASLSLPIYCMVGRRDAHCGAADAAAWQAYTHGMLEVLQYNGGHFFLQTQEAQVVRDIRDRL